jgi:uncharacterized Zn finger protein
MNAYESSGQEASESVDERRGIEAVAKRVHRALDSFFHVEAAGGDGEYTVFSGSGETYTVNVSDGSCTCPDGQRGSWCKHAYRVAFVAGEIPDIDGVRVESEADTSEDTTDTEDDDGETLTERVERFEQNNPGASAIEAISQLGISPDQKERVEEVLA